MSDQASASAVPSAAFPPSVPLYSSFGLDTSFAGPQPPPGTWGVPQSGFNTYLPDPSPASSPCQVLAEALKKYADGNTETKVSCLNMLKKQDESRQQLHVAFMDFFRHENVCHDQAKQTISDLFDGYGATEAISDVLSAQRPPFFGNPPVVSTVSAVFRMAQC